MTDDNVLKILNDLLMLDNKSNELFKNILLRLDEIERKVDVLYELKHIGEI